MIKLIIILKRLKKFITQPYCNKSYNKKYPGRLIKLNLGCGNDIKQGWINIDREFNKETEKNFKTSILKYDLTKGIPFDDNSIDYIYNEHFLEHLTVQEGQIFLKECKRALKKSGILRIAMPDLEETVNCYLDKQWKITLQNHLLKYNMNKIQTRAELINISFREWGHKWLYDKEELERRLREAGFKNIEFCEYKNSIHKELKNLETRDGSTLIAEVSK